MIFLQNKEVVQRRKTKKNKKVILKNSSNKENNLDIQLYSDNKNKQTLKNYGGETQKMKNTEKENFLLKENANLIKNYGPEIYNASRKIEESMISNNIFSNHKMDSKIRVKMVNWMIEVFNAYNSDSNSLFCAVGIMDKYLSQAKVILENSNMHLIGITSMFIASKFEDVVPIRISSVYLKISHKAFSEEQIKNFEKILLSTIEWDVIYSTTYESIKILLFDFNQNNQLMIKSLKMEKVSQIIENTSVYLAKMSLHFHEFLIYLNSAKAIACIVIALDIIKSNSNILSKEADSFLQKWIKFLLNQSGHSVEYLNKVYSKLVDMYSNYDDLNYISHNLNKLHPLYFN